ncbi:hypothetical protein Droror1_Dr00027235 [Drosera rotundifolia]
MVIGSSVVSAWGGVSLVHGLWLFCFRDWVVIRGGFWTEALLGRFSCAIRRGSWLRLGVVRGYAWLERGLLWFR